MLGQNLSGGVQAIDICQFDTALIFKQLWDSLNRLDYIHDYENKYTTLFLLRLDTTMIYKNTLSKILEERKKEIEQSIQSRPYYNSGYIAELCGYVGDKRFIAPLEKILEHKKNNKRVLEALVRMKVEPYYTNYLTERTRSIEDIKKKVTFFISDLTYILNNQESYLEISKYLLSSAPDLGGSIIDYEYGSKYVTAPVYVHAMLNIRDIKNPSLQKIINAPDFDEKKESDRLKVYKWMQKNYGKYEIRRIW
jgi:hypothetical protein